MRKLVRYTTFALLGVRRRVRSLFSTYVYLATTRMFDQRYPVVAAAITASTGPEAIARGKWLADRTGCTDCHKADLRGSLFADDGWLLGPLLRVQSDAQGRGLFRRRPGAHRPLGVRPDGKQRRRDAVDADSST